MAFENFYIEIDGKEVSDLYQELISLEVVLDSSLPASFEIRVPMSLLPDGTWTYLEDEMFLGWKPVVIKAGFESGMEDMMTGYITHIKPCFDPDPAKSILQIRGMDESVLMDREEKLKPWEGLSDSDIATAIFTSKPYEFTPEVEDTGVLHDKKITTVIQRGTDLQLLRDLAIRNGFDCYVENKIGYFRKPVYDSDPQPVLAYNFGKETNLNCFSLEVNSLKPANVFMLQVHRLEGKPMTEEANESEEPALGETDAKTLTSGKIEPRLYLDANAADEVEMKVMCKSIYHRTQWLLSAEGQVAGNIYGHALKVRKPVTIKGVGKTYSGIYYVTHVTHSFTPDGYIQFFKAKRNAINPMGSEDFSASSE